MAGAMLHPNSLSLHEAGFGEKSWKLRKIRYVQGGHCHEKAENPKIPEKVMKFGSLS